MSKILSKLDKEKQLKLFLILDDKFKPFLNDNNVYWIYRITNIENDMVYIGKTRNIIQRAYNYISAYNKSDHVSKIISDMIKEGLCMFTMDILEIALNPKSASIKEKYYIDKYNSIVNGYNINFASPNAKKRGRKSGSPQSTYAKIVKSKNLCAINPDKKVILFTTGLKLFGDIIGMGKDDIKSYAKRMTPVKGYYLYYLNIKDFNTCLENAESKYNRLVEYKDYKNLYMTYIKYAKYIRRFFQSGINDESFTFLFATQTTESDKGYEYFDYNEFVNQYLESSDNILTC